MSKPQPKVSVLLPAYNAEQYIEECLQSLVDQTLKDAEFICINDGSSDKTLSIIQRFSAEDPRLIVIDKPNAGYGAAMNDGLDRAQGEYISILESDDFMLPDMLKHHYGAAKAEDLDFVKSDYIRFEGPECERDTTTERISELSFFYDDVFDPSQTSGMTRVKNLTQPGLYKRSFLIDGDIRWNESPGASYQDNGFWFQVIVQAKRARFLHDPQYMLRRDNPGSSIYAKDKVFAICDEYDFIRGTLKRKGLDEYLKMCAQARLVNCLWRANRISLRALPSFYDRMANDFKELDDAGEIDRSYFTPLEWEKLDRILNVGYVRFMIWLSLNRALRKLRN